MPFSKTLVSSPSPVFPAYLLPSLPFRRRKSSTDSAESADSIGSDLSADTNTTSSPAYLQSAVSLLRCTHCLADICPTSCIISKGFTGRHGRAYLVAAPQTALSRWARHPREVGNLPNTSLDRAVPRQLVTGAHTVADIRCRVCDAVLGWKYVAAEEESQRYKVGKFILETRRVCRSVDWERDADGSAGEAVDHAAELGALTARRAGRHRAFDPGNDASADEIEFDSQDEDECEDLFAGVWTQSLARKRRARKLIWKRDADVDMV